MNLSLEPEKIEEESEYDLSNSNESEEEVKLATQETRAVNMIRLVVLLVMLATATLVSVCVYLFTTDSESDTFKTRFFDQAGKVVDAFQSNSDRRLTALKSFSQQITSHALSANETFPFVTLPDFERRASSILKMADSVAILTLPIVATEERSRYEEYSVENQGWLLEGLGIQDEVQTGGENIDDSEHVDSITDRFEAGNVVGEEESDAILEDMQITPVIYKIAPGSADAAPETGPGPYTPIWQLAPSIPLPALINFNTFSHASRMSELETFTKTGDIMISSAADFKDSFNPKVANRKQVMQIFLNRWKDGSFQYEDGPVSDVYIPIWDGNGKFKQLRSVLTAYVYWQGFFTNILPENANGVISVLENTCDQQFTYRIDGENVKYLGPGDLHYTRYDHMMVQTGFGAYIGKENLPNVTDPAELFNDGKCYYNVRVYPSPDFEDDYVTMTPIVFTIVIVAVFLFACIVFVVYDRLVAVRHKVVNKTAVESTAVVQSLFPEEVRSRLYETKNEATKKDNDLAERYPDTSFDIDEHDNRGGMPIANLHQDCTVMFADIVGFTAWSSRREPTEVFKLLETLYGSFDRLAKRLGVFKVETIGDCYVAVTGLPKPQPNHHVIMAKFACQCLFKMDDVVHKLAPMLGQETTNLTIRVGLHSGPVTAGVLRGDRARFQLFGDTVNSAARLESHGQGGRVHLSETTAELLRASGKENWLEKREDLVSAKGKGIMQTYWVKPGLNTALTLGSHAHDLSTSHDSFRWDQHDNLLQPIAHDDCTSIDAIEI